MRPARGAQPGRPPGERRSETIVDARGLRCPLPLVKAKLAMEELANGDELLVLATDPEAGIDLAAWAADRGHGLTERAGEGGWAEYLLRRSG